MGKAKTIEERLTQSEIIKNLCDSLGVFIDMALMDMDEDDAPVPF